MLFAKVVLGLPIEGPFDYLIPQYLRDKARLGTRCLVPFRNRKMTGFIVGISKKSAVEKLKSIEYIIDEIPILSDEMLKLTREVSKYYLCSWGEAIETALPASLRIAKTINLQPTYPQKYRDSTKLKSNITLIHDLKGDGRWQVYFERIKEKIKADQGVIFLSPEINSAIEIQRRLKSNLNQDVALLHSQQSTQEALSQWENIRNSQIRVVAGTRLAVFAPVHNLGLIIVDNESDQSFKQDQTPHYNARDVAFMRVRINGAELILGSSHPSLEMFYLAKKKKVKYIFMEKNSVPEINIIDLNKQGYYRKKSPFLSLPLENSIAESLKQKQKIIISLNRRGFATYAVCPNCKTALRCPRCNVNLVYHFKEKHLICHYCNYKTQVHQICPHCQTSYIRYSGIGTEKIESELSRIYPQAKILTADTQSKIIPAEADILIATSFIFKHQPLGYDVIAVIAIDNSLNRTDFRAAEKTFSTLVHLIGLSPKVLIIQTFLPQYYCLTALKNLDINSFYKQELAFRKQLGFPPFSHLALIKVRGRNQDRVREKAQSLFDRLNGFNKYKMIKIVSLTPAQPAKLRGNFYWQILIKFKRIDKLRDLLKKNLKDYRHGSIIITIDIDPI